MSCCYKSAFKGKLFWFCWLNVFSTVSSSLDTPIDLSSNTDFVSLRSQILHLEQVVSNLQSQVQTQDQKYAAVLQNVLSKLTEKTDEILLLKRDHNNTLTELASVKAELTATRGQIAEFSELRKLCEANLTSIKVEVSDVKSDTSLIVSNLTTGVRRLESSYQSTEVHITTLISEMSIVKSNLSVSDSNLKSLQSEMSSVQTSLKLCESQLVVVKSDVHNLTTHPPKIEALMTDQYKSNLLDPLTSQLTSLQSSLKSTNSKVTLLTSDVHALQQADIKGVASEVAGLKVDLGHTKGDLTGVRSDVRTISTAQGDLRNQGTKIQNDIQLIQTRLTQVGDECTNNSRSLDALSSSLNNNHNFIAFGARSRYNISTIHNNNALRFEKVPFNIGGGYHENTGIFQAPVSGYYLFWAGVDSNQNGNFVLSLVLESNRVVSSSGTGSTSASLTYLIKVKKGEQVWFKLDHKQHIHGSSYSYYGGTLLHAL